MFWLATKYALTSAVVVLVSEAARRNDRLGAILAALPLVTVLTLIWLHLEKQPVARISAHAWYTFWYVLPTLPMFLMFPVLLPRLGFWPSLLASMVLTVLCFWAFAAVVRHFGVMLG